ncbi:MAG: biopolymer transporter ExbD, partial [Methylophilaceae bacterium]|nr:biopolymer transporter ExbD [Methylophilaceae bacterium]
LAISNVAHGENPTIIISADAKTPHQAVVNVMEAARMGGFINLTFATQSQ